VGNAITKAAVGRGNERRSDMRQQSTPRSRAGRATGERYRSLGNRNVVPITRRRCGLLTGR